jgi:hypothetical protein
MTMVLACASSAFMTMVSDRLVSLQTPNGKYAGRHDTASNKNIVYRAADSIVAIGYSGLAYLEGIPTDQWIAQLLTGVELKSAAILGFTRNQWRLAPAMFHLRERLKAVAGGKDVSLVVAGYRMRRGNQVPVLLRFGAEHIHGGSELRMRPFARDRAFQMTWVGSPPDPVELKRGLEPFKMPGGVTLSASRIRDLLACLIRDKAKNERSVGQDLMEITLDRVEARKVVCRFNPLDPAAARMLSPWIIGQHSYFPPTVISGAMGPTTYNLGGIEVVVTSDAPLPGEEAPFIASGIVRKAWRGSRARSWARSLFDRRRERS